MSNNEKFAWQSAFISLVFLVFADYTLRFLYSVVQETTPLVQSILFFVHFGVFIGARLLYMRHVWNNSGPERVFDYVVLVWVYTIVLLIAVHIGAFYMYD